ncbi:hypothetical protein B0T26DRAFT_288682 [Lasiosphaeria miniovina]|uniref:N-acetyltransferase domain-containing protein n=1 Tax=Lasiosphaeria miniovina TaxID=1954250 RepID=A0AA40AJW4_9PEZI|nr:uncharacterized protein B0T26DRAFT_288682 [Lasiosphaeria miniovina]KAK0717206.1 hypothetical protein B0T26DRAFT_288682 [Lasiosphaeria miniovina]
MEQIISTPRLKLKLITQAGSGSTELAWLHTIYSDEKATFWSPSPTQKRRRADCWPRQRTAYSAPPLPCTSFLAATAIHNARFSGTTAKKDEAGPPEDGGAGGALTVEVAYMFLPGAWGRGFATEAVSALLLAASASSLLLRRPLYVRAIVNGDNAASMRVMDKVAVAGRRMSQRGIYHWAGEPIFHGGRWRAEADLWVYGMYLVW